MTSLDKVRAFIKWLFDWKVQHGEAWSDEDIYAIGIYACYVADTAEEGEGHE